MNPRTSTYRTRAARLQIQPATLLEQYGEPERALAAAVVLITAVDIHHRKTRAGSGSCFNHRG